MPLKSCCTHALLPRRAACWMPCLPPSCATPTCLPCYGLYSTLPCGATTAPPSATPGPYPTAPHALLHHPISAIACTGLQPYTPALLAAITACRIRTSLPRCAPCLHTMPHTVWAHYKPRLPSSCQHLPANLQTAAHLHLNCRTLTALSHLSFCCPRGCGWRTALLLRRAKRFHYTRVLKTPSYCSVLRRHLAADGRRTLRLGTFVSGCAVRDANIAHTVQTTFVRAGCCIVAIFNALRTCTVAVRQLLFLLCWTAGKHVGGHNVSYIDLRSYYATTVS